MYAKPFQKAAFKLESGRINGGALAPGWGSINASLALGANDAIPYLSYGKSKTVNTVEDNSIVSEGFKDLPRKIGSYVEQTITCVDKFDGIDKLLFWGFGLEDEVQNVVCYVCSTPTTEPVAGATYTDPDANSIIFLRKEVNKAATYYIFKQATVGTGQSGTLTKVTGTGSDLSFTARSSVLYEHIFQFDPRERHYSAVRSDEQLSDYDTGDKKCRMALLGLNEGSATDIINYNAMCKKIGFSSSAGGQTEMSFDYLAYKQDVGDQSSSSWTYPPTINDSDNNIIHHQWQVQVGTTVAGLTTLGVTSFDISAEIPLQVIQDTVSGLFLAEPVMEGKYSFNIETVLSRYSSTAWQTISENWTEILARYSATSGYYLQEFLVNKAIISKAGPDEDTVSKEQLVIEPGYDATNNWSAYMYGSVLKHSPIMLRVRNTTSLNMMLI